MIRSRRSSIICLSGLYCQVERDCDRPASRRDATTIHAPPLCAIQHSASRLATPLSRNDILQRRVVQLLLRQKLLQLGILQLKLAQPLRVQNLHAIELQPPTIKDPLRYTVQADDFLHRETRILFLQYVENLLFKIASLCRPPKLSLTENFPSRTRKSWGADQCLVHTPSFKDAVLYSRYKIAKLP